MCGRTFDVALAAGRAVGGVVGDLAGLAEPDLDDRPVLAVVLGRPDLARRHRALQHQREHARLRGQ